MDRVVEPGDADCLTVGDDSSSPEQWMMGADSSRTPPGAHMLQSENSCTKGGISQLFAES